MYLTFNTHRYTLDLSNLFPADHIKYRSPMRHHISEAKVSIPMNISLSLIFDVSWRPMMFVHVALHRAVQTAWPWKKNHLYQRCCNAGGLRTPNLKLFVYIQVICYILLSKYQHNMVLLLITLGAPPCYTWRYRGFQMLHGSWSVFLKCDALGGRGNACSSSSAVPYPPTPPRRNHSWGPTLGFFLRPKKVITLMVYVWNLKLPNTTDFCHTEWRTVSLSVLLYWTLYFGTIYCW